MAKSQKKNSSNLSKKHLEISRDQARTAALVAALAFVLVFSIITAKTLWDYRGFQGRVVKEKTIARDQLEKNLEIAKDLNSHYQIFISEDPNVIGGSVEGDGDNEGDNSRIILDSLPSVYDYPALLSSIEKILSDNGFVEEGIEGLDEALDLGASRNVDPIEMPVEVTVGTSVGSIEDLLELFQRSIRPFNIQNINVSLGDDGVKVKINAHTYFQPSERLEVNTKEVK